MYTIYGTTLYSGWIKEKKTKIVQMCHARRKKKVQKQCTRTGMTEWNNFSTFAFRFVSSIEKFFSLKMSLETDYEIISNYNTKFGPNSFVFVFSTGLIFFSLSYSRWDVTSKNSESIPTRQEEEEEDVVSNNFEFTNEIGTRE